jgi:hypothetical protein
MKGGVAMGDETPGITNAHLRDERDDLQEELSTANREALSVNESLVRTQSQLSNASQDNEDLRQGNEDKRQYIEELEHRVKELEDQKAMLLEDDPHKATDEQQRVGDDSGEAIPVAPVADAPQTVNNTAADELAALKLRFAALQAANAELMTEVRDLRDANASEQTARLEAEQTAKLKAQQAAKADEETARVEANNLKLTEKLAAEHAQLTIRLQRMQAELERTRVDANLARAEAERAMNLAAVADEDGPSLFDDLEDQDRPDPPSPSMKDVGDKEKDKQISDLEAEVKKLNDQLNLPCTQLAEFKRTHHCRPIKNV